MTVVYIRLRHKLKAKVDTPIRLEDAAQIYAPEPVAAKISKIVVYRFEQKDLKFAVLDMMSIIPLIVERIGQVDIQTVGPSQTIVEVTGEKKKKSFILFAFVWILLFLGSGLAIINFHEEVGMHAMHQKLYWIITGKENAQPLLLQIPYAFGIGAGMILFFNHIFKKKFNEEPSPLELELFNYQENLDQYVSVMENKESMKKLDE